MSAVSNRDDVLYRLKGWLSCCSALLLLLAATTPLCVDGFATTKQIHPRVSTTPTTQTASPFLKMNSYGRGAEIWPECNEDPVQLSDSFPNGQVPYSAILAIGRQDMAAVYETVEESITATSNTPASAANNNNGTPTTRSKRQFVSKTVRRILRRAAAKEELGSEAGGAAAATLSNRLDWTPICIASGLLAGGLIRPNDVLLVAFFTTYFTLLGMVARSPREISGAPVLPSMPPQGHVPSLVSNPLGMGIVYSKTYDLWLKLGVVVGLVGPLIQLSWYLYFGPQREIEAARHCARPMFLLCFQAISEAASRRAVAPLPLRILVPVTYNTARLAYLWNWAWSPVSLGPAGRGLAIASAVYWACNLFAFLIPVATLRYMRAHFFGVEAAEVTTRIGMEESIGLIPNQ